MSTSSRTRHWNPWLSAVAEDPVPRRHQTPPGEQVGAADRHIHRFQAGRAAQGVVERDDVLYRLRQARVRAAIQDVTTV
ncbi:MAG: hypothetical protein ACE5F1_02640 [Planctomycetota bacterium]